PDIFVVALVVCAIAAKGDAWRDWIPDITPGRGLYGVLAVLLFAVSWIGPGWSGFSLSIDANFTWIYCLLLFLVGFRRVEAWPLFAVIIAASAVGLVVEALAGIATMAPPPLTLGAFEARSWFLTCWVDYPSALLCAVLYFGVGRHYEQMLANRSPGIRSRWLAVGVVLLISLLAAGRGIDRVLFPSAILDVRGQHLHLFGESLLLPLAGLCGGLWLRRWGVILVAVIVAAFWVIAYNIGPGFSASWSWRYRAELGDIATVVLFGWVGIQMRKDAIGAPPLAPARHWLVFLSATLAVLSEHLLPEDWEEIESFDQLWPLIGAFGGIVAAVLGIAWWRRHRGWPPKNYAGWIALLALVPLVQVGLENAGAQWENINSLVDSGRQASDLFVELPPLLLPIAAYCWGVLMAVRTASREAGEWCRDLLRAVRILARLLGLKSLAAKIETVIPRRESAEAQLASDPVWRQVLVRYLGYVQWLLVVSGVVLLGLTIYAIVTEF
ncbi:MAG TPA: hypothetical protein VIK52_06415, partial [Opitutaceae bacterium]